MKYLPKVYKEDKMSGSEIKNLLFVDGLRHNVDTSKEGCEGIGFSSGDRVICLKEGVLQGERAVFMGKDLETKDSCFIFDKDKGVASLWSSWVICLSPHFRLLLDEEKKEE